MKIYFSFVLMLAVLILHCGESTTQSEEENAETFIEIESLDPQANQVLSATDTIRASLKYAIAGDISSDFGFSISIKFASKTIGETFSIGAPAAVDISERSGTTSIEYPMELIWSNQNLHHPVSCYFYLHQMTSETASKVIARTPEIAYSE